MLVVRQLYRNRSGLDGPLEGMQNTYCGVESLLLLEIVSACLEQFSGALDNYFFRFRDTVKEFGRVHLNNRRFVERLPISVVWEFVNNRIHRYTWC